MRILQVVLIAYYLFPTRYRWFVLLVASYALYMAWEPAYAILILGSTLIDYFLVRIMEATTRLGLRKILLLISVSTNLGLLGAFKYFDFIRITINNITSYVGFSATIPALNLLLPVGISFYPGFPIWKRGH